MADEEDGHQQVQQTDESLGLGDIQIELQNNPKESTGNVRSEENKQSQYMGWQRTTENNVVDKDSRWAKCFSCCKLDFLSPYFDINTK